MLSYNKILVRICKLFSAWIAETDGMINLFPNEARTKKNCPK